jgi:hypothetical protein
MTHDTGFYNVVATINNWLNEKLIVNKPPTLSAATLVFVRPEILLRAPGWSVHYLSVDDDVTPFHGGITSGGTRGRRRFGLLEISCWVTRRAVNWQQQLLQMQDAVTLSVTQQLSSGAAIVIQDYYTLASQPPDTAYRVTLTEIETREPPTDPNPDIERKRLLISFYWVERT